MLEHDGAGVIEILFTAHK